MPKSTYPKLFTKAEKALTATKKVVKADSAKFTKLSKALADASAIARNLPKDYDSIYQLQASAVEVYFVNVTMILEIEDQMAAAGGDKGKLSDLKRKLAAEEKKAQAQVNTLQKLRESYAQLRGLLSDQMAAAQTIRDGLNNSL